MAEAKNIRLYTPGGERISDQALAEDYLAADKAGPFRVGQIDHAFTRVVACATHCCCGTMDLNTFRLVLCHEGKELAAVYTEIESYVDHAQALLKARIPGLKLGYTPPAQ